MQLETVPPTPEGLPNIKTKCFAKNYGGEIPKNVFLSHFFMFFLDLYCKNCIPTIPQH